MPKIENKLTNVPETMLITLWAKAVENQQHHPLLRDAKAAEIVERIDYDFSKFRKAKFSQAGCCVRASLIDQEARRFLDAHPDGVVVQLGCGLDARYERLQRPAVTHWYDLDLPESIALRRQVLSESEHNTYIAASMFDYAWIDEVKKHEKPVLIIVEGVLMYFDEAQVRGFFLELCTRFSTTTTTVLFDMLAYALVGKSRQHDSLRQVGKDVEFKWSMLRTAEMEAWHPRLHLEREYYMSRHDQGRFPLVFRLLYKIPYFFRRFNQRVVCMRVGE